MSDLVIPDSITPVIGWKGMRIWDGQLISPQQWTAWPQLEPAEAYCLFAGDEHDAPASGCTCGIHIARDARYAWTYGHVLVKVAGWGRTALHTVGCRVQYAYPQEIYVSTEEERKLVAGFGVPVFLRSEARGIFPNGREPAPVRASIPRIDHHGLKMFITGVSGGCALTQTFLFLAVGGTLRALSAIIAVLVFAFLFFVMWALDN